MYTLIYTHTWRLAPRMVPPKLVHSFVQMALHCHQGNDTPSPIEEDVRPGKPRQNQPKNAEKMRAINDDRDIYIYIYIYIHGYVWTKDGVS